MQKYMMVDLETLSTEPEGIVLSAGFVVFTLDGKMYQEYYAEYDVLGQIVMGRRMSPETQDWWRRTNLRELNSLLSAEGLVEKLVPRLTAVYKEANCQALFQRGNMDIRMLRTLGLDIPYWHEKDCRAFDIMQKMVTKNNHNALMDCKNQVDHIAKVMEVYNYSKEEANGGAKGSD